MSIALIALGLAVAIGPDDPDDPGPVTFAEHVAPILFGNCTECHRPGEPAPFPLRSYEDARTRGATIAEVAASGLMPPWHPDPSCLPLRDERGLTAEQVDLLGLWVERGMPEGDPSRTPAVPDFPEGWTLGDPDLVVTMDEAFEVPAGGPDEFRTFVFRLDLPEDRWVKAVELRPSAREVVHHALFFVADSEGARRLDGEDGRPGFRRMRLLDLRGSLGGWVLGTRPQPLPDDLAMALPSGTDLLMQTHFHPSGKVEHEKATIGLYLAEGPPSKRLRGFQVPPAFGRFALGRIEAGDEAHTVRASRTIDRDIDLISVGGHAHYICESMEAVATRPDGSAIDLFRIPDWDFDWQGRYFFEEPVRIPAGTRIDVTLVYDNSEGNPRNPSHPPVDVTFGEQSTDEMGTVLFGYVLADERGGDLSGGSGSLLAIGNGDRGRLRGLLGRFGRRGGTEGPGRAAIDRLDRNGDGRVDREEVPDRLAPRFDRADQDGDGALDRRELGEAADRLRERTGPGGD
ncbi:EF-hand domain-containing protein [Tautonia plasticadhaerens]|uniref:EF-hand domain-containing protein n=1 Tax=Tautonia plasticadhaerens TaxID=2527974 RepID=A0A518HCJ9_9BACT|nr:hypothetical protein [Tautonia plasticadhaerens]QDV38581.1 hypothetical protein ElP_65360 [Tautonia plasticadhaerens]